MYGKSGRAKARRMGLVGAAFFSLLLPLVAGCAGVETTAEPVTVTFAYYAAEDGEAYYEALVETFNESYPHITIELIASEDAAEADVLIVSAFDMVYMDDEIEFLALDPFIEQGAGFDAADYYPGTVGLFSRDGKLWAVPAAVDVLVLYYNKDLFDQYGVSYPEPGWTWEDFLDKAIALRDPDADVFGYVPVEQYLEPLTFIYQHGGTIFDDPQSPTGPAFDDPLTIEAMEWYAALIFEHDVTPDRREIYDIGGSVEVGVYQNRVGMWMDWLSAHGGGGSTEGRWPAPWENKLRWGMVPLPRDAQAAVPAVAVGYAISAFSENPDASWQWVTFLSQQMWTPYGLTPARRSLAESDEYQQRVGVDVAEVARGSMGDAMLLSPALLETVPLDLYGQAINRIVNDQVPAREALMDAQREAERRMGD